jgi:hypothetical protein
MRGCVITADHGFDALGQHRQHSHNPLGHPVGGQPRKDLEERGFARPWRANQGDNRLRINRQVSRGADLVAESVQGAGSWLHRPGFEEGFDHAHAPVCPLRGA